MTEGNGVTPQIFLSYSRSDQSTTRRIAEALQREGLDVWWDQTLQAGDAYDKVTESALRGAKAVVVLWSKTSVDSRWVRAEATLADRNRTLVPAMIEPCERPIMFELTHTADLSHWQGDTDDPAWRSFVTDVRRFVERDSAAPSSPLAAAALNMAPATRSFPARSPVPRIALFGVPLVLIAVLAAWFVLRGPDKQPATAATTVSASTTTGVSLAVLPFADMSPDHDQDYFSDGLSEELLNALAQIRDLRVAGRTSSFTFKGKNEDLRVIGQKLGVGHLLEGSVRKAGTQLRITAQLIDASNGAHLWSQTYDRKLEDVFAVQEEISKDVARVLSIKLDVGDMSRAKGGTTDLEAYDKYLHAQQLGYQRGPQQAKQEIQLYREAVAIDPQFSLAWYGLLSALGQSRLYLPESASAALREMGEARARLQALSPDAWWTHAALAVSHLAEHRWAEAEAEVRAMQAAAPPSQLSVGRTYGALLIALGRVRESVPVFESLRDRDPLSLTASGSLQVAYRAAGRAPDGRKEYQRSTSLAGDHALWDWLELMSEARRPGASVAEIRRQYDILLEHDSLPIGLTRIMYRTLGDAAASLPQIRAALDDPAYQDLTRLQNVSLWADVYGDRDVVLTAMHRVFIDMRATTYMGLWNPSATNARTDPRYKQLLRDLKLVDYFRARGNWGDFCKPVGAGDFECR